MQRLSNLQISKEIYLKMQNKPKNKYKYYKKYIHNRNKNEKDINIKYSILNIFVTFYFISILM